MSERSLHPVDVANRVIDSGQAEAPHNRVTHQLSVVDDDVAVVPEMIEMFVRECHASTV